MMRKQFRCPDCSSVVGYRSRPRTALEKYILPLVLLHPVRCADCYRRSYASVFTRVGDGKIEHLKHREAA